MSIFLDEEEDYLPASHTEVAPAFDYSAWLAKGKALAEQHSGHQWSIGDWIAEGEDDFDKYGFDSLPRHLLIHEKGDGSGECTSTKIPNLWTDVEAQIGLARSTLKQYCQVARAYPPEKRFKELGWSHHMAVCSYDRRFEYLQVCIRESGSVSWLYKYAAQQEGEPEETVCCQFVRVPIPDVLWKELKDLGKHYGTAIADLVAKRALAGIENYVDEQAEKLSLELLGKYDGNWVFDVLSAEKQQRNKKKSRSKYRTKIKRDVVFSERRRAGALESWERRRAKMTFPPTHHAIETPANRVMRRRAQLLSSSPRVRKVA